MVDQTPPASSIRQDSVAARAQPVLDAFYDAVLACGREAPFKPALRVAAMPGSTRYDHEARAVVLIPYDALPPARRAAMDRFAAIGTLGLSGREQYEEVFNDLLVAHELGHWVQEVARRPLNRWQAEYEANRMMVAFWRDHPAAAPAAPTERRLANFVAQAPGTSLQVPDRIDERVETYFIEHIAEIETNPPAYAAYQKLMVRHAMAETPRPTFRQVIATAWPLRLRTSRIGADESSRNGVSPIRTSAGSGTASREDP